jgi:Na+/melibiose symporter-like transporter
MGRSDALLGDMDVTEGGG